MTCSRCKDHGIIGGAITGPFAGPWRWCHCDAATERREREPNLLIESNAQREKLLKLKKPEASEAYHGEF